MYGRFKPIRNEEIFWISVQPLERNIGHLHISHNEPGKQNTHRKHIENFKIQLENKSHKTTEGWNFDDRAQTKHEENSWRLEGMG